MLGVMWTGSVGHVTSRWIMTGLTLCADGDCGMGWIVVTDLVSHVRSAVHSR